MLENHKNEQKAQKKNMLNFLFRNVRCTFLSFDILLFLTRKSTYMLLLTKLWRHKGQEQTKKVLLLLLFFGQIFGQDPISGSPQNLRQSDGIYRAIFFLPTLLIPCLSIFRSHKRRTLFRANTHKQTMAPSFTHGQKCVNQIANQSAAP